jgi:hypothetical protein
MIYFGSEGERWMRLRASFRLALLGVLAGALAAQGPVELSRGPDRGTDVRVHGIQVLSAKNRPFSARDHIEWTRTLEDGTVVKTELYASVARNSQGRIYREHRSFVPLNSNQESRFIDIVLLDPIKHTGTTCVMETRRCTVTKYRSSTRFVLNPDGLLDNGMRFLTRENIGHDAIDGVEVTGTRETLQIAAGAVGNDRTLVTTRDFWYSPALQVNLKVTRNDPRIGAQVLQLVNLSLTEPDPKFFQIPSGFVMQSIHREPTGHEN